MKVYIISLFCILLTYTSCANLTSQKQYLQDRNVSAQSPTLETPFALMSPQEGKVSFPQMYSFISNAKSYAYISVYSWSDGGLDAAIEKALQNKAIVRVVLDPALKNSSKFTNAIPSLEAKGAEFKIAPMNMHEKFSIIDDSILINGSANFSSGAQNKYSENIIFHETEKDSSNNTKSLINDFKNEFSIIWNVSKDVVTNNELNSSKMSSTKSINIPTENMDMTLYASSMNWTLKDNPKDSKLLSSGRYQSLVAKKDPASKEQLWTVRDILIQNINSAKKSIYLSLNHFNIRPVSDALIEAVKRGVDVRLAVDNQEYKARPNNLEMSPQFVEDWNKLNKNIVPPVRVKYYSHEPSARFWLLNHHKFALFDYEIPEKTVLLSGSYNLSKNAEQNQFDNLVLYKTEKYRNLYLSFYNEFENLWNLNRVNDKPKSEILNFFLTAKDNNLYPLHNNEAVSLTWPEIMDLRSQVNKKAPGIFSGLTRFHDCMYYNPTSKTYAACPPR